MNWPIRSSSAKKKDENGLVRIIYGVLVLFVAGYFFQEFCDACLLCERHKR